MSATTPDFQYREEEVQTVAFSGKPPSNGDVTATVEAERDCGIIGWQTGDTFGLGVNDAHHAIRLWVGGSDPYDRASPSSTPAVGFLDDAGILTEFDVTQDTTNGVSDSDGQATMLPPGKYIEWSEGSELKCKYLDFSGNNQDFMDCQVYYIVEGGTSAMLE